MDLEELNTYLDEFQNFEKMPNKGMLKLETMWEL